jgi:GntR family transcriptional regulator
MKKNKFENKLSTNGPTYQPLYKQVEEYVTQLIVEQRWKPGDMLPSEFQLADEFKVSQGTVRKALNALTDANILDRKQGVGTFVSERTGQGALYRFFPIVADGHSPELPMSETISRKVEIAVGEIAENLGLKDNEEVIVLSRKRSINGELCILEDIYLPKKYFEGLMDEPEIPHTLYHFYQTNYGHTVQDFTDRIKAVIVSDSDAEALEINKNDALLMFTRLAKSLNGQSIEFRVTRCRSDKYHYLVSLS